MRILLTGASGLLGSTVRSVLRDRGCLVTPLSRRIPSNVVTNWLQCDLTDSDSLQSTIGEREYDACIHCAAITDLRYCEYHPHVARQLHVDATKQLAELLPSTRFIYISTDSVFDGHQGGYLESSLTKPLNRYAATKMEGEQVLAPHSNYVVIRTNIYDIRPDNSNSLAEWAYRSWVSNKTINGFNNIFFNPLHVEQLSLLILNLLVDNLDFKGIINLGCKVPLSKLEFLRSLARVLGFADSQVNSSVYVPLADSLVRPLNTSLCVDYAKSLFDENLLCLESGLEVLRKKVAGFTHGKI